MKFDNFALIRETEDGTLFADVSVTTGSLWWRKSSRVRLFRPGDSCFWRLLDDGRPTDGLDVERLYEAYEARKKLES